MEYNSEVPKWRHKVLLQDVCPAYCSPLQAQSWCNFAILVPAYLPPDCSLPGHGLLRQEASPGRAEENAWRPRWTEANCSSFVWNIAGDGRSLHLKQFLYDWAPPASDHPCLWAAPSKPFLVDQYRIGWLGTHYKGHQGASAILWGTMCEISVREGKFFDDEIVCILRGLAPADQTAADIILATPFSQLSYWARHNIPLISLPQGLWRMRRNSLTMRRRWCDGPLDQTPEPLIFAPPAEWKADSSCTYGPEDSPTEREALYVLGTRDHYLWYRISKLGDALLSDIPPEVDDLSCRSESFRAGHRIIYHAWLDDMFGPHDALWLDGSHLCIVQTNSRSSNTVERFRALIAALTSS